MKSRILDYFDFEKANALLEGFNQATGFVTAIVDLDGNVLFKSGWRRICNDFHRMNPDTALNCTISDTVLSSRSKENKAYNFYQCINGLIDVQIPVIIRNEHIANLFSGQFLFEKPDIGFFREQAKKHGFDEGAYLEALGKVPVVSKAEVENAMNFLLHILRMIIELTDEKLEQAQLNEAVKKSGEALRKSQERLRQNMEDLMESQRIAHIGTWRLDLATNQVVWSDELYKMFGLDPASPPPPYTEHMKLFTKDSWSRLSSSLERTGTLGIPYELELETVTKEGPNGWMWVRGEAVMDRDGRITSLRGAAQDITGRKMTQAKLRHSEEKFQLLFNQAPLAYLALDFDARFVEVNQKWLDTFGYSREEVIGKWLGDFLCPEYVGALRERFEEFKVRGTVQSQVEMRHKDGRRLLIAFEGKIAYDADGGFRQTHGIMQDITEQRKTEKALVHSHDLMRYIIEHNRSAVAVHDRDLRYLYVSKRYLDDYKVREKDVIGKHHYDVFPDLPQKWRDIHQKALAGEISRAEKDSYPRDDGSMEWTRWECRPWYASDGSIGGIIVYTEIITEHVKLLEDLRSKENSLREAQKIAHVGSFDFDTASNQVTCSEEGLHIIGVTQEEMSVKLDGAAEFIHPDERESLLAVSRRAMEENRVLQSEFRIIRQDGGERTVDFHVGPVLDENGNCVKITGTIQDITERKKAEEHLIYINQHDHLTGLYNRRTYESEMKRLDVPGQLPLSVIVADINGLKLINDALGDTQGDKIIMESAKLLSSCCREGDIVFRTGGDEFSILLPRTGAQEAAGLLRAVQAACKKHNAAVPDEVSHINLSLGTDTKRSDSVDIALVLKKAEDSMNQRKLLEKNSSYSAIISSIKATMMEKSHETEAHAERIAQLTREVGRMLSLSQTELDHLELLATLHDIGKVGIPEHILQKPGKLDADEWAEMKKHPEIGYRIAMSSPSLAPIALYILHHHERWDGGGYPQSLKGTDIPLLSRILSVVDSYDAMTEDRIYHRGMTPQAAIEEISNCAGTQFDPRVVGIFLQVTHIAQMPGGQRA